MVVVATVDMAEGALISGPDIVSRGFVYVRESETLLDEAKDIARIAIEKCLDRGIFDWMQIKSRVKDDLTKYLYSKIKRSPMILPVIMNI